MTTILTKPPEGLGVHCSTLAMLQSANVSKSQKPLPIDFNRTIYGAEVPMMLELNIWEELKNLLLHIPDRLKQECDIEISCSLKTLQKLLSIQSKALDALCPEQKNCETFYIHLPTEDDAIEKVKYLLIALFKDHIVGSFNVDAFRIPLEKKTEHKNALKNLDTMKLVPKVKVLFTREYVLASEDKNSLEFNIGKNQKLRFIFEQGSSSANSKAVQIPLNNLLKERTVKDISDKHLFTTAQKWSETAFKNRLQEILKKSEKEQAKELEVLFSYILKSKDIKNDIAMIFRLIAEIDQKHEISKFLYSGIKTMITNRANIEITLMVIEEFCFLYPLNENDLSKKTNIETTHYDRTFSLVNFAFDKNYFCSFPETLTAYTNYFQRKMLKDNYTNTKGLDVDKDKIVAISQKFFLRLVQGQELHEKKVPPSPVNLYKALHLLRWAQSYPLDCKPIHKGLTIVKMYEMLINAAEPYMCLPLYDSTLQTFLRETTFKLSNNIPKEMRKEIYTLEFNAAFKGIQKLLNEPSDHKTKLDAIRMFVVLLNKHQEHFTTKQSIKMAQDLFKKVIAFQNSEYQVSVLRFLLFIIDNYGTDRTIVVTHYAELIKAAKSTPNFNTSALLILKDLFEAHKEKKTLAQEKKIIRHYPSEMEILLLELSAVVEVAKHPDVVKNDELSIGYKCLWKEILNAIFVLKELSNLTQKMDVEIIPGIQNLIIQFGDLELSGAYFSELLAAAKSPADQQRILMWLTWLCCQSGKTEILSPENISSHIQSLCRKATSKKLLKQEHGEFLDQLIVSTYGFNLQKQANSLLPLLKTLIDEIKTTNDSAKDLEIAKLYVVLQLIRKVQNEPELLNTIDLQMIYKAVALGAFNNISALIFDKGVLQHLHALWKELPNEYSKKKELYDIQFEVAQMITLTELSPDPEYWKGRFSVLFLRLIGEYPNYYSHEETKKVALKLFDECCKTNNPYLLGMLPNFISVLEFVEPNWNVLKGYYEITLQTCEKHPGWVFTSTLLHMLSKRHMVNNMILEVMRGISSDTTIPKRIEKGLEAELQWLQLKSAAAIIENKEVMSDKLLLLHYELLIKEIILSLAQIGSEDQPPLKKLNQITPALKYFMLELKTANISLLCVDLFAATLKANSKELDDQLIAWMSWLSEQSGKTFSTEQIKKLLPSILDRARNFGAFKDGSTGLDQAYKIKNSI